MTEEDKPAVQREAEATNGQVTLNWRDLTLIVPSSIDDWDVDTLEAFEAGKAATAIRGLIGSTSYDKLRADFKKLHGRKFTVRDIKEVGDLLATTYGFTDQGE